MTYTYVLMDVSPTTYEEIKKKLLDAGYQHALHEDRHGDGVVLDMHGIALRLDKDAKFSCCGGRPSKGHHKGCIYGRNK